jgi:uncharacterized protein YukE
MGGFSVKPAALTSFATTLCPAVTGGSAASAGQGLDYKFVFTAGNYADHWLKLPDDASGLAFGLVVDATNQLAEQLDADYATISQLLVGSANGLNTSATTYREQDHASAQRVDAAYRPAGVTPLTDVVDISSPAVDPASFLTEPSEDGAVPDLVQQVLDGVGYFSETELALKILDLCGLKVEDWVKDKLAGDFKAFAKCRNAVINLGKFEDAAATTIAEGTSTLMKAWQGQAAGGAQNYFNQLADALGEHANTLSSIGQKLEAVVVAIQQGGSAIMGGLTAAMDAAIEAALSAGAAAATEAIPGLDVLTDIIGAWKVTEVINKVKELGTIWGYVWTGLQGSMAAIVGLIGWLQNLSSSIKLPSAGYANAALGQQPENDKATTGKPGAQ